MAETFICNGEEVHFTNSGCHELYITWAKCASILNYESLSKLLQEQSQLGEGCTADGMDSEYLSDKFCSKEIKAQWLEVMELLINDIESGGRISSKMDINWDDELRAYWLEKLEKLHMALGVQIDI